jgi:hypothetical protein
MKSKPIIHNSKTNRNLFRKHTVFLLNTQSNCKPWPNIGPHSNICNIKHINYTKEIEAQTSPLLNKLESLQDTNGSSHNYTISTAIRDLTSDCTPSIATISTSILLRKSKARLHNYYTNWNLFWTKNGISPNYTNATANFDLTSDCTPSIATISTSVILKKSKHSLHIAKTNWNLFRKQTAFLLTTQMQVKILT